MVVRKTRKKSVVRSTSPETERALRALAQLRETLRESKTSTLDALSDSKEVYTVEDDYRVAADALDEVREILEQQADPATLAKISSRGKPTEQRTVSEVLEDLLKVKESVKPALERLAREHPGYQPVPSTVLTVLQGLIDLARAMPAEQDAEKAAE